MSDIGLSTCTCTKNVSVSCVLQLSDWFNYDVILAKEKIHAAIKSKFLKIKIIMRRDFANAVLVCNATEGGERRIQFPDIDGKQSLVFF